jgi:translation initiation factor 1
MCPHCGLSERRCQCRANPRTRVPVTNADSDGIARVGRSSKGRGGKTVTTITGIQLPPDELRMLAKALKRSCGTGGAIKDDVIEIQGDQRDTLVRELEERGFRVKRSGG